MVSVRELQQDDQGLVIPRIVVINNDPLQSQVLADLLQKASFAVQTYETASVALMSLNHLMPDLIITALYMPDLDGWRLCRLLRSPEFKPFNTIPILVISPTITGEKVAQIAANVGADAFMPYPLDEIRFIEQVRELLSGKGAQEPLRILLVEEHPSIELKDAFEKQGYRVDTVNGTAQAEACLQSETYDVVVLDDHLPDGTGESLLPVVCARQPECTCLMVSAHPTPELALCWLQNGVAAYLRKPFKPDTLIELCAKTRFERTLLRMRELLAARTRELSESEEHYRGLLDNTPVYLSTFLPDGTFTYVNNALAEMTGRSPDELVGVSFFNMLTPEDLKVVKRQLAELDPDHPYETHEQTLLTPDGSRRWQEWTNRGFFDERGVLVNLQSVGIDITEHKNIEKELRLSEEKFSRAFHISPDSININRLRDGLYIEINDGFTAMTGYTAEEVIGKTSLELDIWADPQDRARLVQGLRERGEVLNLEATFHIKNGGIKICLMSARIIEVNGETCILSMTRDITDRKQAEEALRKSQLLLNETQRITKVGGWEFDLLTNKVIWTDEVYQIYEVSKEYDPGNPEQNMRFYTPEDQTRISEAFRQALEKGEPYDLELQLISAQGKKLWVRTSGQVERRQGKISRVFGNIMDITELKQTEEALHRLNRELRAIRNCSQTIVRVEDEQTLLSDTCRIVCDEAGYRLAWVGYAEDDDAKSVRPVAWAGKEDGYLTDANITWADTERGRGPTGTAIRSGKSIYTQDFETDPKFSPWRANALQRGYRSSIALPLKDESGKTFGALTIYSAGPNAFTPEERQLLEEMTDDLAFGIVNLRSRSERKQAETALRESEKRLSLALDSANAGAWEWNLQTNENIWSDELWKVYAIEPYSCQPSYEAWRQIMHPEDRDGIEQAVQTAVQSGSDINIEWRVIDRDGTIRWLLSRGQPIRDEEEKVIRYIGIVLDISERKQMEMSLLESESRFRAVSEYSHNAICLIDEGGKIVWVNDAFLKMGGYSKEQIFEATSFVEFLAPESIEFVVRNFTKFANKEPYEHHYSFFFVCSDGRKRLCEKHMTDYEDKSGKRILAISMVDITERKQAEEALHESEEKFRSITEQTTDVVFVTDDQGIITYLSPAARQTFGFEIEEMVGRSFVEFLAPESIETAVKAFGGSILNKEPSKNLELRMKRKDGSLFFGELTGSVHNVGNFFGAAGTIRDVSERKQNEQALRESEAYVRSKLNAILLPGENIGLLDLTDIMDVQAVQDMMNDFFKLTKIGVAVVDLHDKVLVATGWQDICTKFHRTHPETCQNCMESDTLLSAGIEPDTFKIYKCKNNMLDMATPIIVGGQHVGNLFLGQFLFDDETPEYETFRAQAHRYGFDEKEYLAALERVPRWSRETVNTVMAFYTRFANLISALGYSNIKLARTLTERQRAEEEKEKLQQQLLQAQKMETVGRLAGGVAHDFNNLLGVIMGHAELVLANLTPHQAVYHDLQEILKAAERSAALTHQLLAFARKQTVSPQVLNLTDTVASMLKMLQRLIGENIDLTWHPAPDLWHIKMDPSQIDQILANLLVNARDAIPETGTISIELSNTVFSEDDVTRSSWLLPGEYVLLAVSDNGSGMDQETLSHLFEPFFTTKEVGKGTGLGLATVYGIVKQNNGFINVYSDIGNGTTFKVYLPRCVALPDSIPAVPQETAPPKGQETILIVEDEESLLEIVKDTLEDLGYTVMAANTAFQALRLAEEHSKVIRLLITDVVMPEMDGRKLAEKIRSIQPDIKCLFMSGYTADIIANRGILDEGVFFIQKPFPLNTLAVKVRQALAKK